MSSAASEFLATKNRWSSARKQKLFSMASHSWSDNNNWLQEGCKNVADRRWSDDSWTGNGWQGWHDYGNDWEHKWGQHDLCEEGEGNRLEGLRAEDMSAKQILDEPLLPRAAEALETGDPLSPLRRVCFEVTDKSDSTAFQPRSTTRRSQGNRLWCHIYLAKRHADFDLVPSLIGRTGCHMLAIHFATKVKMRVRGRGSGHLEMNGTKEAPVPLMLAVTSEGVHTLNFKTAVHMAIDKLNEVQVKFNQFCHHRNLRSAKMGSIWRFGEMSKEAEHTLEDILLEQGWASEDMPSIDIWLQRPKTISVGGRKARFMSIPSTPSFPKVSQAWCVPLPPAPVMIPLPWTHPAPSAWYFWTPPLPFDAGYNYDNFAGGAGTAAEPTQVLLDQVLGPSLRQREQNQEAAEDGSDEELQSLIASEVAAFLQDDYSHLNTPTLF
jgi:hypothetical protein